VFILVLVSILFELYGDPILIVLAFVIPIFKISEDKLSVSIPFNVENKKDPFIY